MVFLFITAIEVLTGTWRGRRSLGAVGTGWDNVLLPRLQGTASPGHQVSKPAEGKISIWIRKRKRRASEAFPQGKGLFAVYSQPARSAHPTRSPVFGSRINRCAGC